MEVSNIIKKKYLNKFLNTHKVLRKKQIISLDNAKSIGILAEITDENSYKQIYALFTKLQSLEKSVWLMCYINEKAVPYYCLQQLTADYFCKKNLNWFGKPDFVQMKDFLENGNYLAINQKEGSGKPIKEPFILKANELIKKYQVD